MPYIVSLIILHDINCYLKVPVDKYMNILRNLYQTDTFTRRALWLVPKGVHIKKFYCNIVFFSNFRRTGELYNFCLRDMSKIPNFKQNLLK